MTYKRIPTAVLTLLFFFIVQSSVLKGLSLSGAIPYLLLVLTVSYGYLRGETSAMTVGFFSGLLLDIFGMNVIGLYALIYLYLGYLEVRRFDIYKGSQQNFFSHRFYHCDNLLMLVEFLQLILLHQLHILLQDYYFLNLL